MGTISTAARGHVRELAEEVLEELEIPFIWHEGRLLEATGMDTRNHAATFPVKEAPTDQDRNVLVAVVCLQVFFGFDKNVKVGAPKDPAPVEDVVQALRDAFETQQTTPADFWYIQFEDVNYYPDPKGDVTRFEVLFTAVGDNSAIKYG